MKKFFIAAFLVFSVSAAFAVPMAEMPIKLQRGDITVLADQYPYVLKNKAASDRFTMKKPNLKPFTVSTAKVSDTHSGRAFLIIQEQGDYVCSTQNCPLKIFDVTNGKSEKVFGKIAPPVIHVAQCADKFSLVLTGSSNLFQRWTLGKDGFEMQDTYQSLKEASDCK